MTNMKKIYSNNRGTIIIAIIGAISMLGASILTAWGTSNARSYKVEARIDVTERTVDLHYRELKEDVGEIKADVKDIKIDVQNILRALSK